MQVRKLLFVVDFFVSINQFRLGSLIEQRFVVIEQGMLPDVELKLFGIFRFKQHFFGIAVVKSNIC